MASQGGVSRRSISLMNKSKNSENEGPDHTRKSVSSSRSMYVRVRYMLQFFIMVIIIISVEILPFDVSWANLLENFVLVI